MGPYWSLVSTRFRMHLQYRTTALAGVFCQMFWGLIQVMIFTAFYHSTTRPQPMTLPQVITYIWLGQALLLIVPMFYADADIAPMIRSGTVAYELLRPVDLYGFWYARLMGGRLAMLMLRALPQFVLAGLFFGLQAPASLEAAAAFTVALALALVLSCAFSMISCISTLWHVGGDGVVQLLVPLMLVCCGCIIPLPFFPDWAQPILNALPFRGFVDLPFRIYMGHIPPAQAWPQLAVDVAWVIALVAFGRWLLGRGTRRLVVQGG